MIAWMIGSGERFLKRLTRSLTMIAAKRKSASMRDGGRGISIRFSGALI